MRILITGSREFADYATVRDAIWNAIQERGPFQPNATFEWVTVVHGGYYPPESVPVVTRKGTSRMKRPIKSADYLAHLACRELGLWEEVVPADWTAPCRPTCRPGHRRRRGSETYCPAQGVYRNQDMVDRGAAVTLSFFKRGATNKGTSDCVRRAELADIQVRKFYG